MSLTPVTRNPYTGTVLVLPVEYSESQVVTKLTPQRILLEYIIECSQSMVRVYYLGNATKVVLLLEHVLSWGVHP